jgi:DNA (cytosine-5)-methyltransferase 1
MTFGSLFAGIGGFDLGLERAGMECRWQVEWDKSCNVVLAHHWPDVVRYGDVNDVGERNLEPVDLICGGFPCQDVSVAGKREGLAGERSGLWFEFHRVLAELKPRWVIAENVPGLLSSNGGRDFAVILRGLVELGYGITWRVLDAQFFGVAQRRRRVFIVGSLGDGRSAEVLFESSGGSWDSAPSRETRQGTANSSISGTIDSGEWRRPNRNQVGTVVMGTSWDSQRRRVHDVLGTAPSLTGNSQGGGRTPIIATFQETGKGWWNESGRGGTLRERDWKDRVTNLVAYSENEAAEQPKAFVADGYSKYRETDVAGAQRAVQHKGTDVDPVTHGFGESGQGYRQEGIRPLRAEGENKPSRPSNVVAFAQNTRDEVRVQGDGQISGALASQPGMKQTTYVAFEPGNLTRQCGSPPNEDIVSTLGADKLGDTFPHMMTPMGVRRLTPTECERLQGFPDTWTAVDGMSDSARYRMLGNAVAVPCAEWLGRRIMEVGRG